MAAYITFDGGTLYFDVTSEITHTLTSDITDHPVEKGADITDNARPNLDLVSFECFVSNAPLGDPKTPSDGDFSLSSVPIDPPKFSVPFVPTPGAITNLVSNAIGQLLSPDQPVNASIYQARGEVNYVYRALIALRTLRDESTICGLVTSEWSYDSMLLQAADLVRNAETGTGCIVKLSFKQVRIVESKLVNAPIPSMTRAAPKVAKGPQGPTDDGGSKSSLLLQGAQLLGAF